MESEVTQRKGKKPADLVQGSKSNLKGEKNVEEEEEKEMTKEEKLNELYNDSMQFSFKDLWYSEGFRPTLALLIICTAVYIGLYQYFYRPTICDSMLIFGNLREDSRGFLDTMIWWNDEKERLEEQRFKQKGEEAIKLYSENKARLKKICPRGGFRLNTLVDDLKSSKAKEYELSGIKIVQADESASAEILTPTLAFSLRGMTQAFVDSYSSLTLSNAAIEYIFGPSNVTRIVQLAHFGETQIDFAKLPKLKKFVNIWAPFTFSDFFLGAQVQGDTLHLSAPFDKEQQIPAISLPDFGKIAANYIHTLQPNPNEQERKTDLDSLFEIKKLKVATSQISFSEVCQILQRLKNSDGVTRFPNGFVFSKVEYHKVDLAEFAKDPVATRVFKGVLDLAPLNGLEEFFNVGFSQSKELLAKVQSFEDWIKAFKA